MLVMVYAIMALVGLVAVLAGCVIVGVTGSFLKSSLPFKEIFSVSIYALTPAVLLVIIYAVLSLLGVPLKGFLILFLIIYGVYLVGAARKCCDSSGSGKTLPLD